VDAQGITEAALETGPRVARGEIDRPQVDPKFGFNVVSLVRHAIGAVALA
jgi:hypothetical protein